MIIMGIDPGSRKAGYAFIEVQGKKITYLESGVLRYEKTKDFMNRLPLIFNDFRDISRKYKPDQLALESLIYVKNVTSLAKLAQARGAMIAAVVEDKEIVIAEYSPTLIKSSVTGHGHASKDSVEKTLAMIFGKKITFETDDESDALAIAVCHHLNKTNIKAQSKKQGSSLKAAFKHLE